MRRISEIICEQILSSCECHRTEHGKMDEFFKNDRDYDKIMELDAIMRKNNENRRNLWNELNETLFELIKNKKYDWENTDNGE